MTAVPTIPNPRNPKAIMVVDLLGGEEWPMPVTIVTNNLISSPGLSAEGLTPTTAGVTDTSDKRFVTDQELADLITLQPLAALEAVLAALGARTGGETLLSSTAAVNLNSATPTTLYTVATGKSAVITRFVFRLASTSLTTVSLSIGYNSAAFNDVLANNTHTALMGNTLYEVVVPKVGAAIGTSTGLLKLLCNTLQGAPATMMVETHGYLF